MSDLLTVSQLKKHFPIKGGILGRSVGKVYAVDGVSFSLKKGETLGLVGESGCGKSTLGRTLLRLIEPTSGSITFDGIDLMSLKGEELRKKRRDMQMIFQDPYSSLNPRMTVGQLLAEPFIIHEKLTKQERQTAVSKLLETVGLGSEASERYPHEFSGGQRQRIGIARAIALNPKLVVADEPVSALDVSIQSQILNLLVDLRKRLGLSYVFVAHDLAVIEHISDWVAVMYLGKIVEIARGEDLYSKPSHPYTNALIASIPIPDLDRTRKKQTLGGDVPSPIAPPPGCPFHPRCPLKTDVCSQKAPEFKVLKTGHMAACHKL